MGEFTFGIKEVHTQIEMVWLPDGSSFPVCDIFQDLDTLLEQKEITENEAKAPGFLVYLATCGRLVRKAPEQGEPHYELADWQAFSQWYYKEFVPGYRKALDTNTHRRLIRIPTGD